MLLALALGSWLLALELLISCSPGSWLLALETPALGSGSWLLALGSLGSWLRLLALGS
jgi:hypothetical protein